MTDYTLEEKEVKTIQVEMKCNICNQGFFDFKFDITEETTYYKCDNCGHRFNWDQPKIPLIRYEEITQEK